MSKARNIASGSGSGSTAARPVTPVLGDTYYNGTLAVLEIYTDSGWIACSAPTAVPEIGVATDLGSSRAYGPTGGAATVAFTPGSGGGLPSTYVINASVGGLSATGSSSPITVTGLVPGTNYTFSAAGRNNFGTSVSSGNSNQIIATTVPQAPTIGTATNVASVAYGSAPSATLTFTAAATGGTSITNYKYSTDGTTYTAFSPAQTTSPLTFSGLTSGTSYLFYLKAVNANGDSLASSASNSITAATVPQAPTIGAASVTNGSTASLAFTAGNTGGSAITSYTITSSPSLALTYSGTTSPFSISAAYASSTSYTFTITATTAAGTSIASSASNSVAPNTPKASGGTAINSGGYFYHTFLSTATFTPSSAITNAEVLCIAGGGGSTGGGGGAGGVKYTSGVSFASGTVYTATVGTGGALGNGGGSGQGGTNGVNSNLTGGALSLTAAVGGGGAGGGWTGSGNGASAQSGGSGGGGEMRYGVGGANVLDSGGAPTSGQGNTGGNGALTSNSPSLQYSCGGGGGAGSAGGNANGTSASGVGGNGTSSYSAWGIATSTGVNVSGTRYYAAADGGANAAAGTGWAQTANTGNGGTSYSGAAGNSGIIIVRYQ